jgi:2-polyprenyl-6-methoxyphenol hydroxylase-like FAD-dependent oxidoreductase
LLGCLLAQQNMAVLVLERHPEPLPHSRSVGIHPPSLELLERAGLVGAFLADGVQVRYGRAFANARALGTLDFSLLPGPYPFVLTLPQDRTEIILERHLCTLRPGALRREVEVTRVVQEPRGVTVQYRHQGEEGELRASFAVGCDGKGSLVRRSAGIAFEGGAYPDTYLMGDFTDNTDLGLDAAIYLTDDGLVESFPLPHGVRRWVVKTDTYPRNATASDLATVVQGRTGHRLDIQTNTMLSSFGVQRYLAARFVQGRLLLAGDAAHVLSPIGGQGMNLGWLAADLLAASLSRVMAGEEFEPLLQAYGQERRRAARRAIRRATFNTLMGRRTSLAPVRNAVTWGMLNTPLKHVMARLFTMRGL